MCAFGRRSEPTSPPISFQYGIVPPGAPTADAQPVAPAGPTSPPSTPLPSPPADPAPAAEPAGRPVASAPVAPPPVVASAASGWTAGAADPWTAAREAAAGGRIRAEGSPANPQHVAAPPPAPADWSVGTAPSASSRAGGGTGRKVAGVLVVVLLAGARPGWRLLRDLREGPLTLPDSIAGAPRVTDPTAEQLAQGVRDELTSEGIRDAVSAMYSRGDGRAIVLVAGHSDDDSSGDVYSEMAADGAAAGQPLGEPTVLDVEGGEITCGATSSVAPAAIVCTWAGSGSDGFIYAVGLADVTAAGQAAAEARAKVEA